MAATSGVARQPPTGRVFYSTAIDGDMARCLGQPHYSYRFAEAKFVASLTREGIAPQKLRMPECYATRHALPGPPGGDPDGPLAHLIFRSSEQVRVLHPGYNIGCYAWEFEVLKDWSAGGEHPFTNQKRMLSLCDELWVPCTFTRDVLERHGIGNVHVIPAPIAMPTAARVGRAEALAMVGQVGVMPLHYNFLLSGAENARVVSEQSRSLVDWLGPRLASGPPPVIYLAVLNPEDFRKNIDSLLRGFHYFQQDNKQGLLIVKALTSPDRFTLDRIIADVVPNKLDSGSVFDTDAIAFLAHFLAEEEMRALYCLADFYVSTSMAEGQNLPLLEAMAEGTVPISTANTAMADYITAENAFVIPETSVPARSEHLAGAAAGRPYRMDFSTPADVCAALTRSAQARPHELRAKKAAAVATVRDRYSHAAVWPAIQGRLATMPRRAMAA